MMIYYPHVTGHGVDMFGGSATVAGQQITVYAVSTHQLERGQAYDISGLAAPLGPPVNYPNATYDGPSGGPAIATFRI